MGPTSPAPLAVRASTGKALGEMPDGEAFADAPRGSDRGQRLQDEIAKGQLRMRDGQASRTKSAAAPQDEIEVEHARTPASAATSSEFTLDGFELPEHLPRLE